MVKARKYVVKARFQGAPKRSDFEVVEYELPPLKNGDILIKVEWISVDPYLQNTNPLQETIPYDQYGYQVGTVIESKSSEYPVGTKVVTHKGWCDYTIVSTNKKVSVDSIAGAKNPMLLTSDTLYKLPFLDGLPDSLGLGAVGMPGASAYFCFLELCKPKPGETVAVSGAAGAVGSLVGQIAKIKGCKVIGFAGSDAKVKWLKELGFDAAFNYKTVDAFSALKEAAPNGIDCYFDNVGGELSSIIMYHMNNGGRVGVCGSISTYDYDIRNLPKASTIQMAVLSKELTITGYHGYKREQHYPKAFAQMVKWIKSGQIQAREHVTEGFDHVFDAFIGMLKGENFGKAVVKV